MPEPRTVLVTGASSGIGRATACALARRGDTVVLAARNEPDLRQVARECVALGGRVEVAVTDVTDPAAVDAAVQHAAGRFGRLDAVVHGAAVLAYGGFEDVPADVYHRVLETNLHGTVHVARASLSAFRAQGRGHLVLVGSMLGDLAVPLMSPYIASKWGVHGLARALQIEARQWPGVEVSLVSPPGVPTPIYRLAGNYVGRLTRAPQPVTSPDRMARAIVGVLDRPRRKRRVGPVNTLAVAVSRLLPGVYDALATPYLRLASLTRTPVEPHPGNVFETLPHGPAERPGQDPGLRIGGGPERSGRSVP